MGGDRFSARPAPPVGSADGVDTLVVLQPRLDPRSGDSLAALRPPAEGDSQSDVLLFFADTPAGAAAAQAAGGASPLAVPAPLPYRSAMQATDGPNLAHRFVSVLAWLVRQAAAAAPAAAPVPGSQRPGGMTAPSGPQGPADALRLTAVRPDKAWAHHCGAAAAGGSQQDAGARRWRAFEASLHSLRLPVSFASQ